MRGAPWRRVRSAVRRFHRFERREVHEFRRWLETTENLVHLSLLVFLPLLIVLVTVISNALDSLSFLLFPPLAAGAYTLFAEPEGRYASPTRFVGGLTVGAVCGWAAVVVATAVLGAAPAQSGPFVVHAPAAGLSVFLTVVATWVLDAEEPAAYSTALLALIVPAGTLPAFVASVALSSLLVAGVFVVWRDRFYERRADILYESTKGDDHVLVPMCSPHADATAMLAARLAGAHDAGKVVLLDLVESEAVAAAEREHLDREAGVATDGGDREATDGGDRAATAPEGGSAETDATVHALDDTLDDASDDASAAEAAVDEAVAALEERARTIEHDVGVPCEVVVAVARHRLDRAIEATAARANCDLIAVPYETGHGVLATHIRRLFRSDFDVLVHRSADDRTEWERALVPVRGASDVAHSMIDFARRLVGETGRISVCHCIDNPRDRRAAEEMLADVVAPFPGNIETRVPRTALEAYLPETAREYDVVFLGASQDRSAASRLISPPTFERVEDLPTDVAVVDRH